MRNITLLVYSYIVLIIRCFMYAYTIKTVYNLLIVPAYSVLPLTYSQSFVTFILIEFLTYNPKKIYYEKGTEEAILTDGLILSIVNNISFLILAYIVETYI